MYESKWYNKTGFLVVARTSLGMWRMSPAQALEFGQYDYNA
jgi:hypothetical protein